MLPPISDVTHITLAHCDAVGRGYPPHQFSVAINSLKVFGGVLEASIGKRVFPRTAAILFAASAALVDYGVEWEYSPSLTGVLQRIF